jgi:hypothetical protein
MTNEELNRRLAEFIFNEDESFKEIALGEY